MRKKVRNGKGADMTCRLTMAEKHQLAIARRTLRMSDEMAGVMGGPTKAEAREIIERLTKQEL